MSTSIAIPRREFLSKSTRLTGGAVIAASAPALNVLGANEELVLGLIGCGTRGAQLIHDFLHVGGCRFGAVCDVDRQRLDEGYERVGGEARKYHDYRELLEQKDIDAVVVATNGQWHVLPSIHACQAGKDVYLEKPLSLVPREGSALVKTAKETGRIVTLGTQQHSWDHYIEAAKLVQSGAIGQVVMCESFNYEHWDSLLFADSPITNPPESLDWDFWLGPAPMAPYHINRIRMHYFFWATGGGWHSGWGVHHDDIVHWFMQVDGPRTVAASGGKFWLKDNLEMPDTMECVYEYDGFVSIYRTRFNNPCPVMGMTYGNIFYGSKGTLKIDRNGYEIIPIGDAIEPRKGSSPYTGQHQRNFLECIKTRQAPNSDIPIGHRAGIPGELAGIAYRLNRKLTWDTQNERVLNDPEADAMCLYEYRKPWVLPL